MNGLTIPEIGWQAGSRKAALEALHQIPDWDLIVIGGGITGAGILREASRRRLRVLLVEQRDFAWGTSSRSSKMVHGGLRYLGSGQYRLTRDSVHERERLLREAPGLVDPLPFVMPHYRGQFPGPRVFGGVLGVYDWIAGRKDHDFLSKSETAYWFYGLLQEGLLGATRFSDAVTDDARLVLRVLQTAVDEGAVALNNLEATRVLRDDQGVCGLQVRDAETAEEITLRSRAVINATGAWTDNLRAQLGAGRSIRPLRGSHLVFPFWRLPIANTLSFFHPDDKRPVFLFPWEGVTVVGTTDLDHAEPLKAEAAITTGEIDYLLKAANRLLPSARLGVSDIQCTWAGVRPVIGGSAKDPSKEKREHAVWDDQGLISVAGGKLTTFRLIALDVLSRVAPYLPKTASVDVQLSDETVFAPPDATMARPENLSLQRWRRIVGHYGPRVMEVLTAGPVEPVAGTETLWCELIWASGREAVRHLDDLLLRRTRLGLLLPQGGEAILARLRECCQPVLRWDDARWTQEVSRYRDLWSRCYSVPGGEA
ncbi:glycerol-3-phosphate dehydrogenase/oxidase [Mangrovitalea sediminis]|uniref:glycerol-3-phosphate dehydrogenase/oxidase n=1 Tax=Mangrovitalea sediminis TaxID=1982043 RepID=UPI000BE4BAB1|nr:glycerol-3-phosphate dehydrogenase/oxidase [Mangrovitalea sediminis]